jgi:hypothetical protein
MMLYSEQTHQIEQRRDNTKVLCRYLLPEYLLPIIKRRTLGELSALSHSPKRRFSVSRAPSRVKRLRECCIRCWDFRTSCSSFGVSNKAKAARPQPSTNTRPTRRAKPCTLSIYEPRYSTFGEHDRGTCPLQKSEIASPACKSRDLRPHPCHPKLLAFAPDPFAGLHDSTAGDVITRPGVDSILESPHTLH